MDARVETYPECKVAFVRHVGPYEQCGSAWESLAMWAGPKGLMGPQTQCLGVSYDCPETTPPEKLRYDACITVGEDVQPDEPVQTQTLPGGDFAVTLHKGPYSGLAETYASLYRDWLPGSGYVPGEAPCLEVYLNDPRQTPEAELLTEIRVPVNKAQA